MMKKLTALLLALAMLLGVTTAFAWSCPNCGNENGSKFCTECGTKKPEDVICPNCGTNYGESGPKFCMECGTKLGAAAPAATVAPTATTAPTAAPTATPAPTAAPTATPAPTTEPAQQDDYDVIMYPNDGRLSLIWGAEVGMEYRIHFFPKWHDSIEEDMTEWNLSFGLEYKSTLGVFTINHMPAGQAFWVGVFDAEGNGEYMPYVPELPVPDFTDCEVNVSSQQMIRRAGAEDAKVDSFTLADLEAGSGITPGMYLACFYNNPGEAIETFVQVVIEAPTGDKYVSSVNDITMKAETEDGFGWNFYSLSGNFMVMENVYGEIPTGDYLVSMYLNGKHAGTTSFCVVESAPATATPKPTAVPKTDAALKIIGVVSQGDGTHLLTWEDNGNGPWYVNFVEHWSDDFAADTKDARSSAYWSDASDLTEPYHVLNYLVPGMSYWIEVQDSKGNAAQVVYDAPYGGKSTRNAWIEAWPRVQNGDAYTDLSAFSVENVDNGNCGLYLKINYNPVESETQKITQVVLTLPDGVTFCTSTINMNMFPGGYTYWELWNLDWEFSRVKAWNDSILLGEYKLDVYIEGKYAASTVFEVTEEGAAAASAVAADDDLYGVEIVSITENEDGTATVTWTDANNNGPYEIKYVQKYTEDFNADCETGTGRWLDESAAALGSWQLEWLVPGQAYWICVYDKDGYGTYEAYTPAAAQNFPEFPMEMELSLVWRLGEDADLTVNEFSSAEIASGVSGHGLELWIAYPQLAHTRDYKGVLAITSPDGSRVAVSVSDWRLKRGEASSTGWSFFDLEWYFGIMTNNFGAVPVGDYTVEFFYGGEFVCNGTFRVIN